MKVISFQENQFKESLNSMYDDVLCMRETALDEQFDKKCVNSLPLTMAFVAMQEWDDLYSADIGLKRGTIFPSLDKPFLGRRILK